MDSSSSTTEIRLFATLNPLWIHLTAVRIGNLVGLGRIVVTERRVRIILSFTTRFWGRFLRVRDRRARVSGDMKFI